MSIFIWIKTKYYPHYKKNDWRRSKNTPLRNLPWMLNKQHGTGSYTSLASTRRPVKTVLKAVRKPGLITKNCGWLSWCSCQYFFLFFCIKHTLLRCNTLMCHTRKNWVKEWSYLDPMAIVSCGDEISISSLILHFEQPRNTSVSSSPLTYFASSARTMTSNFTKGRFQRGRFFCTTIVRGCTLSISPWSAGKHPLPKFSSANFLSDSSMIWEQIGSKSIVNSQCIKNYSGQTHCSNCHYINIIGTHQRLSMQPLM